MKHPIYFIGAGPGDPELITVKGKRLVSEADRIVYAGSLIPEELLRDRKPDAEVFDSASLTLSETHALLLEGYHAGRRVVRLHTGDPALYGAIQEQMALLAGEGVPCCVVPGVSVVFAAAAELRRELTLPEVSQTLILTRIAGRTPVPESENLRALAAHQATLAIYLSTHKIDQVVADLQAAYGPDTPTIVAYRVGWPEQAFIHGTLADIVEKVKAADIRRQAIILVGAVFDPQYAATPQRSHLYHENFSHAFRKAGRDR